MNRLIATLPSIAVLMLIGVNVWGAGPHHRGRCLLAALPLIAILVAYRIATPLDRAAADGSAPP